MSGEELVDSDSLLKEAEQVLADRENGLLNSIPSRPDFSSGAAWMHRALESLRGQSWPAVEHNYPLLGGLKYGLALLAALPVWVGSCLAASGELACLGVLVFYAVEAQFVFLFPLAIDGSKQPFRDAPDWTRRAGGTLKVMSVVLPLAWRMLSGGFRGLGFARSWCLGCLAVVIWYERVGQA